MSGFITTSAPGPKHLWIWRRRVTIGHGPGGSVEQRVPLAFLTWTGATVRFAAAIEPLPRERPAQVRSVSWRQRGSDIEIVVDRKSGADRFRLKESGEVSLVAAEQRP